MLKAKVIAVGIALSSCAFSATTTYDSLAAFAAATANPTTIGFNGILIPPADFFGYNTLVVGDVTFQPTGSTVDGRVKANVTKADFYGPGFSYPADFLVSSFNPDADNELDVTFGTPTFAFGLDYGGFAGRTLGTITLSNGFVFENLSLASLGSTNFVGFVSDTPITSFTFVATQDAWVVLDVVLATPTPEPQTYLLMFGAVVAGMLAKRSRVSRSTSGA